MTAGGPGSIVNVSSWWKRLAAILIDGLILAIPVGIITSMFDASLVLQRDAFGAFDYGRYFKGQLIQGIATFFYLGLMNGSPRGQTVGKMALGIRVVDASTGGPIDPGRGFVRAVIPAFAGLICGLITLLDGLWPLWDQRHQALHDKMANTFVVDVPR